jgi:hypothetical protein
VAETYFEYDGRRFTLDQDVEGWSIDEIAEVEDAFGRGIDHMRSMQLSAAAMAVSIKRQDPTFDLQLARKFTLGDLQKLETVERAESRVVEAIAAAAAAVVPDGVVLTPTSAVSKPARASRKQRKSA